MTPRERPGPESVVVASNAVLATSLGEETVLLDPVEGIYYSLNEVGSRVWELLQTPTPVATVCLRLREEYAVEPDSCERDVLRVITDLLDRGLADVRGSDS